MLKNAHMCYVFLCFIFVLENSCETKYSPFTNAGWSLLTQRTKMSRD